MKGTIPASPADLAAAYPGSLESSRCVRGFLRVRDGAIASVQVYFDSDAAPAVVATSAAGHGDEYSKSGLSESEAPPLREQLLAAVREERLFLDPEPTLAHLASHLGMATNHLLRGGSHEQ